MRKIWGDGDVVLLIFAGCAAEFALNRAVDWLFFTGKLPGDPISRLFSTAGYAQHIVFADEETASRTLDRIRAAHEAVEHKRGQCIPDWAHRDVLYMLIDYSERAHELLDRRLTDEEQSELYDVFCRVGAGLGIPESAARIVASSAFHVCSYTVRAMATNSERLQAGAAAQTESLPMTPTAGRLLLAHGLVSRPAARSVCCVHLDESSTGTHRMFGSSPRHRRSQYQNACGYSAMSMRDTSPFGQRGCVRGSE